MYSAFSVIEEIHEKEKNIHSSYPKNDIHFRNRLLRTEMRDHENKGGQFIMLEPSLHRKKIFTFHFC